MSLETIGGKACEGEKVSIKVGVGSEGQYERGLEYDFNIVEESSATVIPILLGG